MGLILVHHDTDSPALYGAVAAAIAATRNCVFLHIAARFDTSRHADAEQHVVATGGLAASGLCWFERLSGKPVSPPATIEAVLDAARLTDLVVPVHPAFMADDDAAKTLSANADEMITVVGRGDHFVDRETQTVLAWRDRFGRIMLEQPETAPAAALRIALVGASRDHLGVYPAALASLGDAADSLSVAVDIDFIDPVAFREADADRLLRPYAGVLLPGGSDMKNVAGQTAVAAFALDNGLPAVGLCLGMQTMATAVAWKTFGRRNANLAEADPDAGIKTFLSMAGEEKADGGLLSGHRSGDQTTRAMPGTRLADLISEDTVIRCNHRFRLNPNLVGDLEAHGLQVSARGVDGAVVDAIEVVDHPFYMGMQGHPELSSRPRAPHPLIVAFLQAALLKQSRAAD
ncbi:gamma-glutamyl-gamma-aminobutyrate hydrolase family protein [Neorhizobium sp. AL 9.2.2]|uniref:glutamine amidotransferase-related protein n=1 Tax=unclassified Neorhizobium TaxID=2629175 RepID=UPI000DDDC3DF|nr:gamma-glutamyl-gamma-aminobutyrate hydrolase family protein [Neorhizobium sp. AL 9.2.2]NSY18494.1 CTP synthase [Neorhizobium sp. AL 9.2.2]